MKYILYLTTIIGLLFAGGVLAQTAPNVQDTRIVKNGDVVEVNFTVLPGDISAKQKLTIQPMISGADGQKAELPAITVSGKNKYRSDKRSGNIYRNTHVAQRKDNQPVSYSASFPFQPWMQTVSLSTESTVEGCCVVERPRQTELASNVLLYYNITPALDLTKLDYELTELEKYDLENPFLHPAEDYEKRYEILIKDREKGTSKVIFHVNKAVIDMDYYGNRQTLASIARAYELIKEEPSAVLKQIVIAGYASPEGPLNVNTRLGEARARAVVDYLKPLLDNPSDEYFEVINGREDWDGLREMVDKCNMPWRSRVLDIIDGYTMEQQERKTRLQQLDGGVPYRYMLQNFYPELRSGGLVQVYYEIERKAAVAATVSDEHGRTTYVDPDSPANRGITAINNSIDLLKDNRFREALAVLEEFSNDPRTWNYIGVCYMMGGDHDNAAFYLGKALENGDRYAAENLAELEILNRVSK